MPLQETSGTASYDAFGGGVVAEPNYIESCFSTWLYTGNGSTQTITNGIDLAGKGGLVWTKIRNLSSGHNLFDTERTAGKALDTSQTIAQYNDNYVTSFNSNGFTGTPSSYNFASWTFRKQPKFFDVVTYTGNGSNYRAISHSLGSTPGMVIVKSTSASGAWAVWHRSTDPNNLILNSTSAAISGQYSIQDVGSTSFAVASSSFYGFPQSIPVNDNGATYVAYLFAHNAGGFGLTGTDNVISCGSFNPALGFVNINLGYEPQWILFKRTDSTGNWRCYDTMRGWTADINSSTGANAQELSANLSDAEVARTDTVSVSTTGFRVKGLGSSGTYIYIAIRRGPMKTPTSGTSVFAPVAQTGGGTVTTNFPVDMTLSASRTGGGGYSLMDRLRGGSANYYNVLNTPSTAAESTGTGAGFGFDNNTGYVDNGFWGASSIDYLNFRRAPGFFDEVCYTGTGATNAQTHNLGVAPELVITKSRSGAFAWSAYVPSLNINIRVDSTAAGTASGGQVSVSSTAVTYSAAAGNTWNGSGNTYVAYLFASCSGVSKVGSYTGNGSTQTINCGFTGGARFVLIKRTDSTGDWYVYDTARGMTTLTDPYLLLNSTAAESATLGSVTSVTGGFALNASILAAINTNGGSYIFLAIS